MVLCIFFLRWQASYTATVELGNTISALFEQVQKANSTAIAYVTTLCHHLTDALCAIITVLNPELIVIGGSTGRYSEIFIPILEQQLDQRLPKRPILRGTALDGDASLKGAVAKALVLARRSLVRQLI